VLNANALTLVRIPLLRGVFFQFRGATAEWPALADWALCVRRLGDSEEMNNKVISQ
jgi:hypothetical protein